MIAQTLHEYQAKEIAHIGELVREGLDSSDLIGARSRGKLFAYRNELRDKLRELLVRAGNFGRSQVFAELKRQ